MKLWLISLDLTFFNTLRLTKIDTFVLFEALYPKLDSGTPNLELFELEINNSLAI